ncbi:hypothetical protein [Cochleicola gelatinilyticus]|uniref:ParB/Sulfiredoxin domain-containing protein n=1 Tax=Cochleicola gelatinilyticus TaxID=1763537 RepID=A0A167JTM8_9FLAO|nr:hypothetical protein [Cochleicola gelatinilyticus]OAB81036.1 hypothetical protein ULVI_01885 [Cochleicola gelatinilyticus]
MNKETRIKKIQEVIDKNKQNENLLKQEIMWEGKLEMKTVYNIPLEYLIYNKYNGRILSRTKSLEKQKHSIDAETKEGKEKIEQLLWDSKEVRNKKTEKSIEAFGQQKVGIITRDGIIIDGNRRAMLLNKIKKYDYFKAIVLPVTLEESPIEIEKLETTYQMGEDEKLRYNAIEKYLKAREILNKLKSNYSKDEAMAKIAEWMGESVSTIKGYLDVFNTMDQYLRHYDYDGIYTQLDDREDQFISLTNWVDNFYGGNSRKPFGGYTDFDVDDLKAIAFDYIRVKYEGKEFRLLAHGMSENHFFGNKEIWNSFSEAHFNQISNVEELEINFDSPDLKRHLDDRDAKFKNLVKDDFQDNVDRHNQKLEYNRAADKPEKGIKRSIESFDSINKGHKNFSNPEVQDLVEKLGNKVFDSLNRSSPTRILSHIISLLKNIEASNIPEDEIESLKEKTKEIQSLGYRLHKEL